MLLSLILFPYMTMAQNDTGDFEITGESSGYSYSNGVLTVNDGANITISMASGVTEPTSDRIVVNGNAEITLNGVNITGATYDSTNGTDARSAIDVSESATLILNLSESSQNTLTGGSGGSSVGAPGISVPSSASLVIQGSGGLSVTGGNSTNTYGGNGIGGISFGGQPGEACGTVIILATGNVTVTGGDGQGTTSDGLDIGGGLGTTDGDNGQGIKPTGDDTYTIYGELELPCGITIPEGTTVIIPESASLDIGSYTLTNNGTIRVEGTLDGEVSGTVQKKLTAEMVMVAEGTYTYTGQEIKPDVTVTDCTAETDYTLSYSDNTNAGTATITVAPTKTGKLFGDEVTETFIIDKATPSYTVPQGLTATHGQTLADVTLPDGWMWETPTQSVGEVGEHSFKAIFTPTDTDNYEAVTVSLTVTVVQPEEPEPEEPDTPVIPDMPDYYNIMVEECEGVTVETSSTVVREGQSMTFTIDIAEGYTDENMTVKVKRSLFGTTDIIEPNDEGIYEVKNIYTDIYIIIDGVEEEEETPTGMEEMQTAKVYTKDGSIYVQTPQRATVSIVSMTGAVVEQSEQIGQKRYDLPRGIYIICIDEQRYKVRN